MKNIITILFTISALCCISCGGGSGTAPVEAEAEKPLNITIFVDLSDRLINGGVPTQVEKDTAIVGHIADYFLKKTRESQEGLQESKNAIQVLFYPAPQSADMVKCASELVVDIPKCTEGKVRRDKVLGIKESFLRNLDQIYNQAMTDNNFVGCDIWGFFSYKKVDAPCIRSGYRNVLFILTDGYIYDSNTANIVNKDTFTYIAPKMMPQILNNPKFGLKVERHTGLEDLEIAVMEVAPTDPKHLPKMKTILDNWFKDMGATEENITIVETGLPANTRTYIDGILN